MFELIVIGSSEALEGTPSDDQFPGGLQLNDFAVQPALSGGDHIVGHLLAQVPHRQFAVQGCESESGSS